ncbi:hypothetical protein DFH07DRAFT_1007539 [Mycena maculata]|uniref:Uncharacterized protein n=1 Tax=Mycena maculata TaxID=230809 RepID=A0AAD7MKE8_9AGAR|nr:hypothetical protein DFH07DRAFT_1007539 [Mycena maculata]
MPRGIPGQGPLSGTQTTSSDIEADARSYAVTRYTAFIPEKPLEGHFDRLERGEKTSLIGKNEELKEKGGEPRVQEWRKQVKGTDAAASVNGEGFGRCEMRPNELDGSRDAQQWNGPGEVGVDVSFKKDVRRDTYSKEEWGVKSECLYYSECQGGILVLAKYKPTRERQLDAPPKTDQLKNHDVANGSPKLYRCARVYKRKEHARTKKKSWKAPHAEDLKLSEAKIEGRECTFKVDISMGKNGRRKQRKKWTFEEEDFNEALQMK